MKADDDKHSKREHQIKRGMFILIVTVCGIVAVLAVWQHKAHLKEKHLHAHSGLGSLRKKHVGTLKDGLAAKISKLHHHHADPGRPVVTLNAVHHHHDAERRKDREHLVAHPNPDDSHLNGMDAETMKRKLDEVLKKANPE